MRQNNDSSELNEIITDDESRRSVSHLHLNKSPGPDDVCIELYKCTKEYILPFYAPEGTSGGILKSHRPSVR